MHTQLGVLFRARVRERPVKVNWLAPDREVTTFLAYHKETMLDSKMGGLEWHVVRMRQDKGIAHWRATRNATQSANTWHKIDGLDINPELVPASLEHDQTGSDKAWQTAVAPVVE